MMNKVTPEQIKILKKSIDRMAKSDEQFIFMVYKNKNGTDNVTEYCFNMIPEKIAHYFKEAVKQGIMITENVEEEE